MDDNQNIDNRKRVERIMDALQCETAIDLVTYLNKKEKVVYASTISRWMTRGMYKSTSALVDVLIERIEELEKMNG